MIAFACHSPHSESGRNAVTLAADRVGQWTWAIAVRRISSPGLNNIIRYKAEFRGSAQVACDVEARDLEEYQ